MEYLVRWKGWGPAHDSWESKENMHVGELLKEYFEKNLMAIRRARLEGQKGITSQQCLSSLQISSTHILSPRINSMNSDQGSTRTSPTFMPSNTHTSARKCTAATITSISTIEALDRESVGRREDKEEEEEDLEATLKKKQKGK